MIALTAGILSANVQCLLTCVQMVAAAAVHTYSVINETGRHPINEAFAVKYMVDSKPYTIHHLSSC